MLFGAFPRCTFLQGAPVGTLFFRVARRQKLLYNYLGECKNGVDSVKYIIIAAAVIVLVAIAVALAAKSGSRTGSITGGIFTSPEKRAGINGEKYATYEIKKCLDSDDLLLTNVCVEFNGKRAELDNLIINRSGVYIIEVKSYRGRLFGGADDYEWEKYKVTDAGNVYEQTVKNPIKQVNRQVYVLANYLKSRGIRVWVSGYAYLVYNNSPVQSDTVLESLGDIYSALHPVGKSCLSSAQIKRIKDLLD